LVAQFVVNATYGTIVSFVAGIASDRALTVVGTFFAFFALIGLVARLVTGRAYEIWGLAAALTPTFLALAMGMGLLAAGRDQTWFLVAALLAGIGIGGVQCWPPK
jgi:hypothetical protein